MKTIFINKLAKLNQSDLISQQKQREKDKLFARASSKGMP